MVGDSGWLWGQESDGPESDTATGSFGMVKMFLVSDEDDNLRDFFCEERYLHIVDGRFHRCLIDIHSGDIVSITGDSLAHLFTADLDSLDFRNAIIESICYGRAVSWL